MLNKTFKPIDHFKKHILITGGNRGIGYGILDTFCKRPESEGYFIGFTSRHQDKGDEALNKILTEYPHMKENIQNFVLDVSKEESLKESMPEIIKTMRRVDLLFNNAGIYNKVVPKEKEARSKDIEQTFRTNFYGLIRVTEECFPLLQQSSNGHIINLSSEMFKMKFKDPKIAERFLDKNLNMDSLHKLLDEYSESYINGTLSETGWDEGTPMYGCYGVSKVFVNAFTRIFYQALKKDPKSKNLKINAVAPGWTKTDMGGKGAIRSLARGADTPVWLESFESEGPSGNIYMDKKQINWM